MEKILEINHVCKTFCNDEVCVASDLDFWVSPGETFTVLGESGCGKSTLLRMIAGFEVPDRGEIKVGGKSVFSQTLFVPPEKRNLGIIFQNYALFPHMNVKQNIMFGLEHLKRDQRKERTSEVIELSGLEGLEERFPHELSGGQQQRVAFARAIAPKPDLLLMDEPFSNLDATLKATLRAELKKLIKESGMSVVLVTHDQQDAFELSDRIAIMRHGQIEQIGTPKSLYFHPRTLYVTNFFGQANILDCKIENGIYNAPFGEIPIENIANGNTNLVIRPESIRISEQGNFSAQIREVTFNGAHQSIWLESGNITLQALVHYDIPLERGMEVKFSITSYNTLPIPA